MEKMNSFTKIIKIKLIFASICAIFPILTIILFELPVTSDFIHQYFPIKDEPVILRYLILIGLELFIAWKMQVYIRYLSSKTFKENYVIGKTDERNDLISMKTNRYTIRAIIYVLCGAAIISSFINNVVFFVISGILLIALITYIGTYIYFSRKYWQILSNIL